MQTERRRVLALSGALLAGMAGCVGDSDDDTADIQPPDDDGQGPPDDTGDGETDVSDSFDDYEIPPFPQVDFVTDPDIDQSLVADQIRGNTAFALDIMAVLRADADATNLFISPYSISIALAMTYAGARGDTADEIATALRFELGQDDLHPAFGAVEREFERRNEDGETVVDDLGEESDEPGFQFRTANSLWGQEDFPFEEDFLDLLAAYYGAGMQLVDFHGSPEEARQAINTWVEDQTNDRIQDLLPANSVSSTTRLVLVNAIYFLASWKHDFDKSETAPGTFTSIDGTEHEVQFMHQSVEVPYAEIGGHKLVELPYANDDSSMVLIVPAAGTFEDFEEAFTVDKLATMLGQRRRPAVDLAMPKFELESEFSLVDAMSSLGMERAFGGDADFSAMSEGGLFIDDIRHKSFISVDEDGTEAAAATAVAMDEDAPSDFVELTIDRPFLFYIRDRPTDTPLFFGRVVDGEQF